MSRVLPEHPRREVAPADEAGRENDATLQIAGSAQKFLSACAAAQNAFNTQRHLTARRSMRRLRDQAFAASGDRRLRSIARFGQLLRRPKVSVTMPIKKILCERGREGQEPQAGYYGYNESRKAMPSPIVAQIVE